MTNMTVIFSAPILLGLFKLILHSKTMDQVLCKGSVPSRGTLKEVFSSSLWQKAEVGCWQSRRLRSRQAANNTVCYFYHCLGQITWNLLATPLSSLWVRAATVWSPQSISVLELLTQLLFVCFWVGGDYEGMPQQRPKAKCQMNDICLKNHKKKAHQKRHRLKYSLLE